MNYRNLFILFSLSLLTFTSEHIIGHTQKCHSKKCCIRKYQSNACCSERNTIEKSTQPRFRNNNAQGNQSEFEKKSAFSRRIAAACLGTLLQQNNNIECQNNGDECRVPNFAAQFSKTLEHSFQNELLTFQGEASYRQLVQAINNGQQAAFNAILRAPNSTMKLVNPQAALAFSLQGKDSSLFAIPLFPTISSPEAAALMLEDYLMELTRDVLFNEYGTGIGTDSNGSGGSLTNDAAAVLQDLGNSYKGPRNTLGIVDASVVFRGNFYGSLLGPYISQFLLLPISTIGAATLNPTLFTKAVQTYPIASNREFGVSFNDYITIQNGRVPKPYTAQDFNGTVI